MKRKSQFILACGLLAALGGGAFAVRKPFVAWRARRLVATAQAQLSTRDFRSAALGARAVLQVDPDNLAAYEILARIAAEDRSPAALVWRQKLVQLQPGKAGPLIDLANAAVTLGETSAAEAALNQVPETERNSAAYHQAAAAWSMALRQYANAERHFQQALEADPGNRQLRLNLAIVRLALAPPAYPDAPRAELEALRQDPALRLAATRALLADARQHGDAAAALKLAQELHAAPDAGVTDQLLYLEELRHAKSPDFDTQLTALCHSAANPGVAYAIMEWMNAHGLAAKTVEWHGALPAPIRGQIPEAIAVAEACTQLGDWKSLRQLVNDADWGPVDFLRLAFATRLIDETSGHLRSSEFLGRWESAVTSTGGNPNAIAMLARLVQGWGWKSQGAQLWWLIANRNAGQSAALVALYEMAMADKDTRELYRVSRRLFALEPASPVAKNNVAMFALLLGEDLPEAHRLAAENFKLAPEQPVILATYAFSLYRQKKPREAADLLSTLPPRELADPSISACYGAVLAALGEKEKAQPFLDLARREKSRLFPEEAALVEQALAPPAP